MVAATSFTDVTRREFALRVGLCLLVTTLVTTTSLIIAADPSQRPRNLTLRISEPPVLRDTDNTGEFPTRRVQPRVRPLDEAQNASAQIATSENAPALDATIEQTPVQWVPPPASEPLSFSIELLPPPLTRHLGEPQSHESVIGDPATRKNPASDAADANEFRRSLQSPAFDSYSTEVLIDDRVAEQSIEPTSRPAERKPTTSQHNTSALTRQDAHQRRRRLLAFAPIGQISATTTIGTATAITDVEPIDRPQDEMPAPETISMQQLSDVPNWRPSSPLTSLSSHQPLYFEDVNLERYGTTDCACLQPLMSAARFGFDVAALPYQMSLQSPRMKHRYPHTFEAGRYGCEEDDCLPWDRRAALKQAVTVLGIIAIFP